MTELPVIRPAEASDAGAVSALTRKAYEPWIALIGRDPLPMQVDYDEALRVHHFALMELDRELVGFIETKPDGDGLLIVNVAVDPTNQGQGLGRQLILHAEASARSTRLSRVRLYTNKLFARNLKLYVSLGYSVDREEALNGGVAVHMSKQLA